MSTVYVTVVRVVRSLVALVREEKVMRQKIVFSLFKNARRKKTDEQKNVVERKKGGKHLFWRACGGYHCEHINHSDWLNLIRMEISRMEIEVLEGR